jgi:hypothetical protein
LTAYKRLQQGDVKSKASASTLVAASA